MNTFFKFSESFHNFVVHIMLSATYKDTRTCLQGWAVLTVHRYHRGTKFPRYWSRGSHALLVARNLKATAAFSRHDRTILPMQQVTVTTLRIESGFFIIYRMIIWAVRNSRTILKQRDLSFACTIQADADYVFVRTVGVRIGPQLSVILCLISLVRNILTFLLCLSLLSVGAATLPPATAVTSRALLVGGCHQGDDPSMNLSPDKWTDPATRCTTLSPTLAQRKVRGVAPGGTCQGRRTGENNNCIKNSRENSDCKFHMVRICSKLEQDFTK